MKMFLFVTDEDTEEEANYEELKHIAKLLTELLNTPVVFVSKIHPIDIDEFILLLEGVNKSAA